MIKLKHLLKKIILGLSAGLILFFSNYLAVVAIIPACNGYEDPEEALICQEKVFQQYGITFLDKERKKCTPSNSSNPAVSNKSLFVLGDSIGEGLKGPLAQQLGNEWVVNSDTRIGRPLSEGISVAKTKAEEIKPAGSVLVALGTNNLSSGSNEQDIEALVNAIRDSGNTSAKVYWLKINVTRSDLTPGAENFNRLLAANSNITTIDSTVEISSDGVHPSDYTKLAEGIVGSFSGPAINTSVSADCQCGAIAVGGGSNNEETVFKFFVANGYTKEQAAGIVGNMIAESGVNPKRVQSTKTPEGDRDTPPGASGYGLVQWTPGTKILPDAEEKGQSPGDLNFQMNLLLDQLAGRSQIPEKRAGDDLKLQTTVADAAKSFMLKYERPKDQSTAKQNERARLAEGVFQRYSNNVSGVSATNGGECSGGTGSEQIIDGFVVYNQYDERWASKPYGTSTIAKSGCGPSALAMVVSTWKDKSVTPDVVAAEFGQYYIDGQGSSWSLFTEAPKKWGLTSRDIGKNIEEAKAQLRAGNLIIVSGQSKVKPFTNGGHILVFRGITAEGKILVGDSGHSDTSDKEWDEATLTAAIKNMWVISQ